MTNKKIIENWNERKSRLKEKFRFLTDNDLMFEDGNKEEIFGKLQKKLDISKEELRAIISTL